MENLAYRIEFGDFRALHLGDAFLDQNREHLDRLFGDEPVDLLFFEGWNPPSLEIIREKAPRHVLAMHLPPDPEQIERITAYLKARLPDVDVIPEPGGQRVF